MLKDNCACLCTLKPAAVTAAQLRLLLPLPCLQCSIIGAAGRAYMLLYFVTRTVLLSVTACPAGPLCMHCQLQWHYGRSQFLGSKQCTPALQALPLPNTHWATACTQATYTLKSPRMPCTHSYSCPPLAFLSSNTNHLRWPIYVTTPHLLRCRAAQEAPHAQGLPGRWQA